MAEPEIRQTGPERERGAALMTVLLLVAVMAMVSTPVLERLTLATRLAQNGAALDQARAAAGAAEYLAQANIGDLVQANRARTTLAGDWLGTPRSVPVPGGVVTARVGDGGNCFNLNSVVAGTDQALVARPQGIAQFQALMALVGVDARAAGGIAPALSDWIDSDSAPQPGGAEDETYSQMPRPYRTPNGLIADASELRAVAGVTPAIFAALKPYICALPTSDLSPINVNTLLPEQAALFAMLLPGRVSVDQARALLDQRPPDGYESASAFWAIPARQGLTPDAEVMGQTKVSTRWFGVDIAVAMGNTDLHERALIDAGGAAPLLVRRTWDSGG